MRARRLIEGSTYGPEVLKVLGQAFDEAWLSVAHHFSADPKQQEAARLRLAHAILAVTREEDPRVDEVKDAALRVMALSYPNHLGSLGAGSS